MMDAINEAVKQCEQVGLLIIRGDFLWPTGLSEVPVRIPDKDVPESQRELEYIPPEEIDNAIKLVVRYAIGISSESLLNETARVFGYNHLGNNIKDKLFEEYTKMLKEGKLVVKDNVVTAPPDNAVP
jgi:hypothetical protein